MKKYIVPEAQVVTEFSAADIITLSTGWALGEINEISDADRNADNVWYWN